MIGKDKATAALQSLGSDRLSWNEKRILKNIALEQDSLDAQVEVAMHIWQLISTLPAHQIGSEFCALANDMIFNTGHKILTLLRTDTAQKLRVLEALEPACVRILQQIASPALTLELHAHLGSFYATHARLLDTKMSTEYYLKAQNEHKIFADMLEQYPWTSEDLHALSPSKYITSFGDPMSLDRWVRVEKIIVDRQVKRLLLEAAAEESLVSQATEEVFLMAMPDDNVPETTEVYLIPMEDDKKVLGDNEE